MAAAAAAAFWPVDRLTLFNAKQNDKTAQRHDRGKGIFLAVS